MLDSIFRNELSEATCFVIMFSIVSHVFEQKKPELSALVYRRETRKLVES